MEPLITKGDVTRALAHLTDRYSGVTVRRHYNNPARYVLTVQIGYKIETTLRTRAELVAFLADGRVPS